MACGQAVSPKRFGVAARLDEAGTTWKFTMYLIVHEKGSSKQRGNSNLVARRNFVPDLPALICRWQWRRYCGYPRYDRQVGLFEVARHPCALDFTVLPLTAG